MSSPSIPEIIPGRGQTKSLYADGIELSDGTPVRLPIIALSGRTDGPVMTLTAGVHGTEIIGIEIIRRVIREQISPQDLSGTIIALPVVNPLTIQTCAYVTPNDGIDIMGAFPGNPTGSVTQRLAAKIWNIIRDTDYLVDIHHIESPAIPFAIVWSGPSAVRQKALRMAEAAGLTVTQPSKDTLSRRTTTQVGLLMARGKPSLVLELPFARVWEENIVNIGTQSLLNILRHLGMLRSKIEKQTTYPVLPGPLSTLVQTATRGGLLHPTRKPGDMISKGESVATIVNVLGDEVENVTMPNDGYLISYLPGAQRGAGQAVASGDWITFIGFRETFV